jgi:hypothetical protein
MVSAFQNLIAVLPFINSSYSRVALVNSSEKIMENCKKIFILIFIFLLQFSAIDAQESSAENKSPDTLRAVPSVHVLFDNAGYLHNRAGLSGESTGIYDIEFFRYGRVSDSFVMNQRTLFGGNGRNKTDPAIIQYLPVELVHLRYNTGVGSMGFILDHECYNYIDKEVIAENRYRWYGAGFKFQTYGMRAGNADWNTSARTDPKFKFLNNFNYELYASRRMKTVAYPYKYFFQADVRYDLFKFYHVVPYISASARTIVADTTRIARSCEVGTRIVLPDLTMTPYAGYRYRFDIDAYRGTSSSFKIIGLRIEKCFTDAAASASFPAVSDNYSGGTSVIKYPEIHFSIGYKRFLANSSYGYSANSDFRLDLFSIHGFTLYGEMGLTHYSSLLYSDLYPRWLEYTLKGGIFYHAKSIGQLIDLSYADVLYRQGDFLNPSSPGNNILSLAIKSAGMDSGLEYSRRKDGSMSYPVFFDIINWKLSAGKIISEKNTGVTWIFSADVRWNLADIGTFVIYIQPGTELVCSQHNDMNYSCEAGVRVFSAAVLNAYVKYQYRYEIGIPEEGRDSSICVGIKIER